MKKNIRKYTCLAVVALISALLASCGTPAEINVPCNTWDLRGAINSANSNPDTTKLILSPNCPYIFTFEDNQYGGHGPNALPAITTRIQIEGNNATLQIDAYPGMRFFFITGNGVLILEDVTLEGGTALPGPDHPNALGGAIYNDGGGLTARHTTFQENTALQGQTGSDPAKGGAIFNLGTLILEDDTLFVSNHSHAGGAIFSGDVDSPAILKDVRFESNVANGDGGAIYNGSMEFGFTISGSTFESNHSYIDGGAIYTAGGDLGVSNSEFLENQAGANVSFGDGGAIYSLAADVTLIRDEFRRQSAYGDGGMLYAGQGSSVALRESLAEENRSCHNGGALYNEGMMTVLETTLRLNEAGGSDSEWNLTENTPQECFIAHGGAIYNSGGILILDRSLLENNQALGFGDGVYNQSLLSVLNSTFHYNCCEGDQAVYNTSLADISFSTVMESKLVNSGILIVKNIVVTFPSFGCSNWGTFNAMDRNIAYDPACPFSDIYSTNLDLGIASTLSDNGGPTLTHEVFWNNYLVNTAITCSTVGGDPVTVDQRGFPRPDPSSNTCDIGAIEVQNWTPPTVTPGPTATFTFPPPPPPPTEPPVVIGCLVQTTRGGGTECVFPCPEDAYPGTPCTP